MNPFSALSWLWKALRGRSVTFAALFALTLMGFSVLGWLYWGLRAVGIHWLLLLILPTVVIMVLAKKERIWMPDENERRKWARGLVFGSIIAAVLAGFIAPKAPPPPADSAPASVAPKSTGPRSK